MGGLQTLDLFNWFTISLWDLHHYTLFLSPLQDSVMKSNGSYSTTLTHDKIREHLNSELFSKVSFPTNARKSRLPYYFTNTWWEKRLIQAFAKALVCSQMKRTLAGIWTRLANIVFCVNNHYANSVRACVCVCVCVCTPTLSLNIIISYFSQIH